MCVPRGGVLHLCTRCTSTMGDKGNVGLWRMYTEERACCHARMPPQRGIDSATHARMHAPSSQTISGGKVRTRMSKAMQVRLQSMSEHATERVSRREARRFVGMRPALRLGH